MPKETYDFPWEAPEYQTVPGDVEEYEEICPAGEICPDCKTEIKEMYDDHPCLGHFCQCNRNFTD